MNAFIVLIVYGLATWRVSSLFVKEGGPGNVFLHIRELTGIEHDDQGNVTIIPDGFFPSLLSCVWCCSLWVALFFMTLQWTLPRVGFGVGMVFAASAVAIWVERVISYFTPPPR